MSAGSNAAVTAGVAAAAAIAQAIKACGVLVHVEPQDFATLIKGCPDALVVYATGGFWKPSHQYLTSYKGLAFFTKSPEPLDLHAGVELIRAGSIYIPG